MVVRFIQKACFTSSLGVVAERMWEETLGRVVAERPPLIAGPSAMLD